MSTHSSDSYVSSDYDDDERLTTKYSSSSSDDDSETREVFKEDDFKDDIPFDVKQQKIDDVLVEKCVDKYSIKRFETLDDAKCITADHFLHVSDDRLSTVGTGYLTNNPDINFIWKVSESWDFNLFAEFNILKELEQMREWCPHFVRAYTLLDVPIHPSFSIEPHKFIPFNQPTSKKSSDKQVSTSIKKYCRNTFMLLEELEGHLSVYDYITKIKKHSDGNRVNSIINSMTLQSLLSIYFANEYCDFTHYDLHTSNILMEDTDDDYRLYITKERPFFIRTRGLSTVVIDTGYSYSKCLNNISLDSNITNFTTGYTPIAPNIYHDIRTLLFNMVWDYPKCIKETNAVREELKTYVMSLFKTNHVNFETGWLKLKKDSIFVLKYYINDLTKECRKKSIFYKYDVECFDVLAHLITLPLVVETKSIVISEHRKKWMAFYSLFARIENKCGEARTFRKYIWKECVDCIARNINSTETFELEMQQFLKMFNIVINDFDYKQMMIALLEFMPYYEIAVVRAYNEIDKQNKIDFAKLPSPIEIISNVERIIAPKMDIEVEQSPHLSQYEDGDNEQYIVVHVYDSVNRKKGEIMLTHNELPEFNKKNDKERAEYLLKKYNT